MASIPSLVKARGVGLKLSGLNDSQHIGLNVRSRKGTKTPITDGTKGGRPRDIAVIAKYANETFNAIIDALNYALKNKGFCSHLSQVLV